MPPAFRITIGADLGDVARVGAEFAGFAEANGVPEKVRRGMAVALDELVTNTITYGFGKRGTRERGTGEVTVEAELREGQLSVTLTDDGSAFDPWGHTTPDTTGSLDMRRIGGLGIHLVKQMMDEVGYRRAADRNIVTLTKRIEDES
ncbi:MAG TPA: ATP-binding protein [Gemmatimonadales bacterium]